MEDITFAVLGTGGIGRRTLEVSADKDGLTPVAACDRHGVAVDHGGLDADELLAATEGNIASDGGTAVDADGGTKEHGAESGVVASSQATATETTIGDVVAEHEALDAVLVALSYDELLDGCERELAAAAPGVLEGIGGLRVPLADGQEVVDLVADLDLPALVVARSGLGTLNHSALTVEALNRRGVDVLAVVLNDYAGASLAERTNPSALADMVDPPVYRLPELALDRPADAVTAVRGHLPDGLVPGG